MQRGRVCQTTPHRDTPGFDYASPLPAPAFTSVFCPAGRFDPRSDVITESRAHTYYCCAACDERYQNWVLTTAIAPLRQPDYHTIPQTRKGVVFEICEDYASGKQVTVQRRGLTPSPPWIQHHTMFA
jgi:hypothetical protein